MIPTSLRRLLIRAVDGLRVTIFAGKNLRRRFPFLGEFHDRVIGLLMPKFIKYQGHIIYLDTMDSLGLLRNASFEEQESEVIKKFVKKGDAVFDLGANIGFHTLTLAKNVGKLGKVFSFEPCPETFSLLQKNVKANGYDNIVLIPKAVSEKSGHAKMHVEDEDGNFLESVAYNLREGGKFFYVEVVSLDEFFSDSNMKADFIKMDIEGFEEKALKGMRNLLQRSRTVKILTEFYPKYLILAGTKPEDYLKQLSGLGFKVYDLHGHDVFSRPASVKMLLERYTFENNHLTNLLCLR